MSEYDREIALQKEEEAQNTAAGKIQRQWREYVKRRVKPDSAAMTAGDGGGEAVKELTEEEIRDQQLERSKQLLSDRESLLATNMNLQRALSKLFADRRASQGQDPTEQQTVTADVEAKYWTQVQKLRDERLDIERQCQASEKELEHARQKHEGTIQEAQQFEHNFREFVKEKAKEAIFARNNKGIPAKRIEEFEAQEDALYAHVHETRITYIKLRNRMKKISHALSDREKKKDGMNLIDFEQLKIENTNLNEKIEERNEDLLKLRKKATTTIHVLTHVKEKMEFVKNENAQLQKQVAQFEEELCTLRDRLASSKRERDVFTHDNQKMKEKMPMIGSEDLLLDYEVRKKEIENCRIEVVDLTNKHHELMQWINNHQSVLEAMQQQTAS
jgi:hypothetical protein